MPFVCSRLYRYFALHRRRISEEDIGDNWFAKAIANRFICQDFALFVLQMLLL